MTARLLAGIALAGALAAPASAQITLSRATVSSGVVDASGGTFALRGTIGEPAVGAISGGSFVLCQGFDCQAQAAEIRLSLAALLQGPYPGTPAEDGTPDVMRADLADVLPEAQPYADAAFDGTALDYDGTEAVEAGFFDANPDYVDWVLVGVRSDPLGPDIARRAFLLHASGAVHDTEGGAAVAFDVPPGGFHVVVYHRNHLALMSTLVTLSGGAPTALPLYDAANIQGGAASGIPVETGIVALVAGDANADGSVLADDRQAVWLPAVGAAGYQIADLNLDGSVLATDRQLYLDPNVGRASQVPGAASLRPQDDDTAAARASPQRRQ